ncbi:MAG: hypothetical protein JWO02_103 [Solirubrobacterales bacterium]|nr:hypothetical protein [Solirubrobacterales bacterium]
MTAILRVAVLLCGLAVAASATGCGGGDEQEYAARPVTRPAPPASPSAPAPVPAPVPALTPALAPQLSIGVDEQNPWLFQPGAVPEGFAPWRDRVAALRPVRYRMFVDWSGLQPDPARPADLAQPNNGCMRGLPPCGAYAGIRDRLRAIAARQKADGGGWEVMVVLYGAPEWAARPAGGCERVGTGPRARPYNDAGLAGYRTLIRDLLALGRAEGVALRWWSPFNEPNHPAFISPQRQACSVTSPSLAPGVYTGIVRAAQAELAADVAKHDLVLGEMAGYGSPSPRGTGIGEFVRALPDDVACAATVWSQHEYTQPDGAQPDAVGQLERVLDERPCTRGKPIWVTETGVGGAHAGGPRSLQDASLAVQCAAQATLLERLDADPRVGAAVQFSLRDDPAYPVGFFDSRLTRAYPTLGLWQAWSTATREGVAPPQRPVAC